MQVVFGVVLVVAGVSAAAGCGRVAAKSDADTDVGGSGACISNDQCAEPTPYCDPGSGCVGCLQSDHCPVDKPTCDSETHACRACAADSDCDSTLCDLSSGRCVPEAEILFASPGAPDAGTCPKNEPCSLAQATAIADPSRHTIKLAPGTYSAHVITTGAKKLVIYGFGATISNQGTEPIFQIQDGAYLSVQGAILTGSGGTVVRCETSSGTPTPPPPSLNLFRTTIEGSKTAVLGILCNMTVEESTLRSSSTTSSLSLMIGGDVRIHRARLVGGGPLSAAEATVQITNSTLKGVGSSSVEGTLAGGAYDVSFSTIVDSVVRCGGTGAVSLKLNSSILYNTLPGAPSATLQDVTECSEVRHSVVFPQASGIGSTNVTEAPRLRDVAADDFHLSASSPAIDRGDPASTNAVDFDGTPRPQGSARDSGAFEYKP